MATYLNSGVCGSICSHPSCWNYSRKIYKNQLESSDNIDNKNPLSIDIPHQSILNFNLDDLPPSKPDSSSSSQYNKNDSDIIKYLISRRKVGNTHAPNVTPQIDDKFSFKESANIKTTHKLPKLDVHELFDVHELHCDWRNTFKSKHVYVWIPRHDSETSFKKEKECSKTQRFIKTPVLQLAPVIQSEVNSARKQMWSASTASEINNSNISKTHIKKIQKRKTDNLRVKSSNRLEEHYKNSQKIENFKECIRRKSLEATLCPSKMPIHSINDRIANKFDSFLNNQIYVMDSIKDNKSFNFITFENKSAQRFTNSPEIAPIDLESINVIKSQGMNAKTVSIIDDSFSRNDHDFRLGPQRNVKSLNKTSSRSQSSAILESTGKNSICDSMITNALSNRSTLNDEDIFPGTNMLQQIQNFHMKENFQTIRIEFSQKLNIDNISEPLDEELQKHEQIASSARSLVENNSQITELPDPPPPSPEISIRIRLTSSVTNADRISLDNSLSEI